MSHEIVLILFYYGLFVLWILVPLLPAVVIYKLFPNSPTQTEWKISGIVLKAGGAAGFYAAIFGAAYPNFVGPTSDYIKSLRRSHWTIEAPITFPESVAPASMSSELMKVDPFAYDFKRTDTARYLVTLRFYDTNGDVPNNVRLIFAEGEGYIDLKKLKSELKSKGKWDTLEKTIDLREIDPIKIRPPHTSGQNQPLVAGLPKQLQHLEVKDSR